MRAIVLETFGGLDSLVYKDIPSVSIVLGPHWSDGAGSPPVADL